MIERSEAPVIIDQTNKNYYMPSEDKIHVMSPEQYKDITRWYATIAHEIGHSTGHPSRLDRKAGMESRFGQPEYAKEELRAELTAAMIGKEFGLPMDEIQKKTHAAYLQNWIRILKNDPNELFRAANDAQEAVEYIREHMMDKTLLKNLNEEMILPDISKEKGTEITNKELAIERVNQNPWSLKYVSEELSKDMHVVIPAVIKEPLTLQFAHPLLRESAEVVTNATARKAEALQFAAGSFKEDSEFMEWLVHEQPLALEYAAINVRNNFTVVLAAVNKDIHALEYAGKDITADKEIMEFFVQRNGMALEYASDELKNDKDLVQKAMIQNPEAFQYATQSLRNNKKFVMDTMNTVNDNTFVWIRHAGSLIQNDPDIWALEASIQDHGRPQPVRIDSKEVTVDHLPQPEVPKEAIKTLETKRQEKKRPGINFGQAQGKGLER